MRLRLLAVPSCLLLLVVTSVTQEPQQSPGPCDSYAAPCIGAHGYACINDQPFREIHYALLGESGVDGMLVIHASCLTDSPRKPAGFPWMGMNVPLEMDGVFGKTLLHSLSRPINMSGVGQLSDMDGFNEIDYPIPMILALADKYLHHSAIAIEFDPARNRRPFVVGHAFTQLLICD